MFGYLLLVLRGFQEPVPRRMGIGHRLLRRKGLGSDEKQRFLRRDLFERLYDLGAVDIGNEMRFHPRYPIRPERFGNHDRTEIAAADADIDDVFDLLAGITLPPAAVDPGT